VAQDIDLFHTGWVVAGGNNHRYRHPLQVSIWWACPLHQPPSSSKSDLTKELICLVIDPVEVPDYQSGPDRSAACLPAHGTPPPALGSLINLNGRLERRMAEEIEKMTDTNMEQIKIALSSLYLCLEFAMKHIADREGSAAAADFKERLIQALKSGDINMALLEESKTFALVASKIEELRVPQA
jgi:hypothetical protein